MVSFLRDRPIDRGTEKVEFGSFVGRTVEIAAVMSILRSSPVVTLTGAPGVGKSCLARQVAACGHPELPGRAVTLSLAGLDPADVAGTASAALDTQEPLLVVLNDCDGVWSECADLIDDILARNGDSRVIATSRQPLGMRAGVERVWRLPSLSVPEPGEDDCPERLLRYEAAQLFCDRAMIADPDFSLSPANSGKVAEICRRLDGIPLAVELAAGRLGDLSLEEVIAGLDSPFTLLVDHSAARPHAHRSLRAALESSTKLLTPTEATLWRRLSVFGAGFSAEAAVHVGHDDALAQADVPDILLALVTKSLLVTDETPQATSFRMLGFVRRLAWEALDSADEADAIAERHTDWCVAVVEAAGDPRRGRSWLERLAPYAECLETALGWATATERIDDALRLGSAHIILCQEGGRSDTARAWIKPLIALSQDAPPSVRASGLRNIGVAAALVGEFGTAIATLNQSAGAAQAADDPSGAALAVRLVGFVSMLARDYDNGLDALDKTAHLARTAGDDAGFGEALAAAGRAHVLVGDPATGRRRFSESLDVARRAADPTATANALIGLGWAALMDGDQAEAESALGEGLTLARRLGDTNITAIALAWLGELARVRGDEARARSRFEKGAEAARAAGAPYPLGRCLLGLGHVALSCRDTKAAKRYFDEALRVARDANMPFLVGPALRSLGETAAAAGDAVTSRTLVEAAVVIARECGDRAEQAACRSALAGF